MSLTLLPRNLLSKYNKKLYLNKINDIIHTTLKDPPTIPVVINGEKIFNETIAQSSPYLNNQIPCYYSYANKSNFEKYFDTYNESKEIWNKYNYKDRSEIFLTAADLIKNKYYEKMLAYTIISQGKNIYEAELDSVCELVDFLNFNVYYYNKILDKQPISFIDTTNTSHYNPLNGFVASITPFNFTAIGGNLASSPLLFGNSVLWKPSDYSILSNYLFYEILIESGLPKEVLNFAPCNPSTFLETIISRPDLAAILFTGSSQVFDNIYQNVGNNVKKFNNYPRLIGETGGKNFHFIHESFTDIKTIVKKTIESAFNYSGQKCSACSRLYLPKSMWVHFLHEYLFQMKNFNIEKYGLINKKSYQNVSKIIDKVNLDSEISLVSGGKMSKKTQFYLEPTLLLSNDHDKFIFKEEFFAPILSVYLYDDLSETMNLCSNSSNYALTGAVFSKDSEFKEYSKDYFKYNCGNFYINDKSTGSIVGQQPFGGGGKSGTNDKAGDFNLLYRLFNQQNIKETII